MRVVVLLIIVAWSLPSLASKEGVLPLSRFEFESPGVGESGPVTVTGTTVEHGGTSHVEVKVRAFSREYDVPREHLAKLKTRAFNGVRLSYERGYRELGGRTIYLVLEFGFTSRLTDCLLVTLSEDGKTSADVCPARR